MAVYNSVMAAELVAKYHAADHDPGADKARICLGLGDAHGRSDQFQPAANADDARRASGPMPNSPGRRFTRTELGAFEYGNGVWLPDERPLAALRAMLPVWFPRVNEIIRLLGSHNHFTAPTTAQFADLELRPLLDKYLHGAKEVDAEQRARIFRLAWDFTGSALASRNEQYERFYLGSAGRNFLIAQMYQESRSRQPVGRSVPARRVLKRRKASPAQSRYVFKQKLLRGARGWQWFGEDRYIKNTPFPPLC